MKSFVLLIIWSLFSIQLLFSQQGYTFTRIGTEDGTGLASNVVYCTYRDQKGYIWVGTANGLQRFDGSKFVQISADKQKNILLVSSLTQIIPGGNHTIWLSFPNRQEFGLFNTSTYQYQHIPIDVLIPNNPLSETHYDANGVVQQNVTHSYTYDTEGNPVTRKTTSKMIGYPEEIENARFFY
ncbi:MAG: hypothetical protein KGO92_02700 [Bacteroidota bacterium]|nr:hypothetical protein [Bacteroidota bacterium]